MNSLITKFKSKTLIPTLLFFVLLPRSVFGAPPAPGSSVELANPLKVGSIEELLVEILEIAIVIATPIVIFFIIYAGFMYVTARGNPANVEKAHKAITYALIGGVLIIGAVAIGEIIQNLVGSFKAD
jgi:hypothetical protein